MLCAPSWRVRGLGFAPSVLSFRAGVEKAGREPAWLVLSPLFSFVERMAGLEPATFTLGG